MLLPVIAPFLLRFYNALFLNPFSPDYPRDWARSMILLLPKGSTRPGRLLTYRPIHLLDIFYKVFTALLLIVCIFKALAVGNVRVQRRLMNEYINYIN